MQYHRELMRDNDYTEPKSGQMAHGLAALAILVLVVLTALFAGQSHVHAGADSSTTNTNSSCNSSSMEQSGASAGGYRELPAPGSAEAQAMMNDPNTPESVRATYVFFADSSLITADLTAAFLQQLQLQLPADPALADLGANIVVQPFIRVSADILNYFRFHRSEALLPLLREYSSSGGTQPISVNAVDQDQLRSEITVLLDVKTLDEYYRTVSARESGRGGSGQGTTSAASAVKPARQASGRR